MLLLNHENDKKLHKMAFNLTKLSRIRGLFNWRTGVYQVHLFSHEVYPSDVENQQTGHCKSDLIFEEIVRKVARFKGSKSDEETIRNKISLLTKLGCSLEQILETPHIATFRESTILTRYQRLQDMGYENVTVDLLKNATNEKKIAELSKVTQGYDTKEAFMKAVFQCNDAEWENFAKKYKKSTHPRDMVTFKEKVDVMLSENFPIESIRDCIPVFRLSVKVIKSRLQQLHDINPQLATVKNLARYGFDDWIIEVNDSEPNHLHKMANIDVTDDVGMLIIRAKLPAICEQIFLLSTLGYTMQDMISCQDVLKYTTDKIQAAWEFCCELEIGKNTKNVPLDVILVALQQRTLTKPKISLDVRLKNIAELLTCDVEKLVKHKTYLGPLRHVSSYYINEIVEYLETCDFSKCDISNCPMILCHDVETIQQYLELTRNIKRYQTMITDKRKHLNLLLYHIEANADVIIKHDVDLNCYSRPEVSLVDWTEPDHDLQDSGQYDLSPCYDL